VPKLIFELKKRADAKAQLVLVREDGTRTMGTVGPAEGFGPVHDLTHFAIESTLALDEGFLGMCASGWEIADFEVKGTAARLPREAIFAEVAAGELSRQLMMRQVSSLEDFLWAVDLTLKRQGDGFARPEVTQAQFDAIHERIADEWRKWRDLAPNGTLQLIYVSRRRSNCAAPTAAERKAGRLATA
jgi:hypothetical protein